LRDILAHLKPHHLPPGLGYFSRCAKCRMHMSSLCLASMCLTALHTCSIWLHPANHLSHNDSHPWACRRAPCNDPIPLQPTTLLGQPTPIIPSCLRRGCLCNHMQSVSYIGHQTRPAFMQEDGQVKMHRQIATPDMCPGSLPAMVFV